MAAATDSGASAASRGVCARAVGVDLSTTSPLAGATYYPRTSCPLRSAFNADVSDHANPEMDASPDADPPGCEPALAALFEAARALKFPPTNRGITRTPGAPRVAGFSCGTRGSHRLPPCLHRIAAGLVDAGVLDKWPRQISVNHYGYRPSGPDAEGAAAIKEANTAAGYEMIPHKDGFADQAAIVSLGSDTQLEFWRMPVTAEERAFRNMLAGRFSGTEVFEELADRPADTVVWLEPGSVLVCQGNALTEFAHGLRAREHDVFPLGDSPSPEVSAQVDGATVGHSVQDGVRPANAGAVSVDALEQRAAVGGGGSDGARVTVSRSERVSIVLWTEYMGGLNADGVEQADPS